jgi:Flp pilus assembly pilin Flp
MTKMRNFLKRLWNDESGQGMAEYVLLIVVVLTVAFMFKDKIKGMVSGKLDAVSSEMNSFNVDK